MTTRMQELVSRAVVVSLLAVLVMRCVTAVIICPFGCFCLSDTKVICNKGSLEAIPDNLPTTVEELKFSRNPLPGLTSDMFRRWRKIQTLTLDDNAIRDIKPFAFRGLASLHEISIQNNPLSELPQFSFAGLENVSLINLSKNRIQTIHPYVFAGSRNLGIINLKENPLIRVEARAFSGLRNVHFIYLPFWVKVIESDAFYDMEGVGLLCLHSLDLHALRPHTFSHAYDSLSPPSMTENFVPCSCQLRWVLDSPTALQAPLFSRHNFCVSPYTLHGKAISTVDLEQLSPCAAPQEYQGADNTEVTSGSSCASASRWFVVCAFLVLGGFERGCVVILLSSYNTDIQKTSKKPSSHKENFQVIITPRKLPSHPYPKLQKSSSPKENFQKVFIAHRKLPKSHHHPKETFKKSSSPKQNYQNVIESDAFYDMEGVGLLCLHSLDLHALRPHTFRGLRNVTQISIKESDLGVMREEAFSGLQNVGELRIISNKVDVLESLEILQESNVDGVVVTGNHFLQVTRQRPFRIQANLRSVVTENFVPCSCQLRWVLDSPTALQAPLFSRHNFCVSPYTLHGKAISTVDLEQLSPCAAPQEYQGADNTEVTSGSSCGSASRWFVVCAFLVLGGFERGW
ncbi:slit homolog 2 protein-like [Penaeus japonicus]|uniref:slit homolog 2 protein-like n=1 Tax=Penaeus japonicus TaxID=27405 RepID=UPI001C70F2AD|nr:slit homolog 2 protein-like [Penaeus japonicus]